MKSTTKLDARIWGVVLLSLWTTHAISADLTIQVSGVKPSVGQVGCALFKSPEGFPMQASRAVQVWVSPATEPSRCEFKGIEPGQYAVSVNQDENANRAVDTNLFGVPSEAWGVSNNARPLMRAPRWSEAVFSIPSDQPITLSVRIQ